MSFGLKALRRWRAYLHWQYKRRDKLLGILESIHTGERVVRLERFFLAWRTFASDKEMREVGASRMPWGHPACRGGILPKRQRSSVHAEACDQ